MQPPSELTRIPSPLKDSVPALASSAPGSELPLPLALQQLKQVAQASWLWSRADTYSCFHVHVCLDVDIYNIIFFL